MKYYLIKKHFSIRDKAVLKNENGEIIFKIKGKFIVTPAGKKLTISDMSNKIKARVNNRIRTKISELAKWSEVSVENMEDFVFRFKDSVSFEFENLNWQLNLLTLDYDFVQLKQNNLNSNVVYQLTDEKQDLIMKLYSLKTQVVPKYMLEVDNDEYLLQCVCIALALYF